MQSLSLSLRRFFAILALLVMVAGVATAARADSLASARSALEKYQNPFTAIREGFLSTVACVQFAQPGTLNGRPYPPGAMGVHLVNFANVGKLDPAHPQVLLYQPFPDGTLKLAGAEWFAPYSKSMKPPTMFGQTFYGPMMGHYPVMPVQMVHYDLHVWLWLKNPAGTFAPTNAALKCPSGPYTFTDKTPTMPSMTATK